MSGTELAKVFEDKLRGIPHFGSVTTWCEVSGMGRSLSLEMLDAKSLVSVEIEGRRWVDIWASLAKLHEAAQAGTPVNIPGPGRAEELARKQRMNETRRANMRARALARPGRQRGPNAPPIDFPPAA
jgi:hypothetical protein